MLNSSNAVAYEKLFQASIRSNLILALKGLHHPLMADIFSGSALFFYYKSIKERVLYVSFVPWCKKVTPWDG